MTPRPARSSCPSRSAAALAGVVPLLAAVAWHVSRAGVAPEGRTEWPTPLAKATGVFLPFHRYDLATEGALVTAFAAIVALLALRPEPGARAAGARPGDARGHVLRALRRAALQPRVPRLPRPARAPLCLAVRGDRRVFARRPGRPRWAATIVALVLVAANLGVLAHHLLRHDAVMRDYRQIAAQVPAGATFAPVATRPRDGTTNPYLHAGNFATVERGALAVPVRRRRDVALPGEVDRHRAHRVLVPGGVGPDRGRAPRRGISAAARHEAVRPARFPAATRVLAENDMAALLEVERPATARGEGASQVIWVLANEASDGTGGQLSSRDVHRHEPFPRGPGPVRGVRAGLARARDVPERGARLRGLPPPQGARGGRRAAVRVAHRVARRGRVQEVDRVRGLPEGAPARPLDRGHDPGSPPRFVGWQVVL